MDINWASALVAALWAIILGLAGGALTEIGPWYRALRKPAWQPPDWLFGPAWTVIL
ncbi:MAG: tryptophan-rich sensory protein, partial [Erythrobacter cryptus]